MKDEQFLLELRSLKADLQVVVAFRMLPELVWNMPKYGTINLHASLLPQYRGAAPINWAIINGEKFEVDALIADEVLVKEIVLDGVILEFKNKTFLLPKL